MRILITGGKGFIGYALVERCVQRGDIVFVIDNQAGGIYFPSDQVDYASFDIAKWDTLSAFVRRFKPDAVVHLAAWSNVRESMRHPVKLYHDNVLATAALIQALQQPLALQSVVFASSSAAKDPESHYGVSKLAGEMMWLIYEEQMHVPTALLRFGNVYGARQNPRHGTLIARSIERIIQNEPMQIYGTGRNERDYICVTDLVSMILTAISQAVSGVANASTGKLHSTLQVVDIIRAQAASRALKIRELDYLEAVAGDKLYVELKPHPLFASWVTPIDLEDGIAEQLRWRVCVNAKWHLPMTQDGLVYKPPMHQSWFIKSFEEWVALGGRL